MHEFRLGIIGRCMALQPYMSLSNIYHRQLKEMFLLKEEILLRVALAGNSNREPMERLQWLLERKPIDGILYHMRGLPCEQSLIQREKLPSGKNRYFFNPLFFDLFHQKSFVFREGDVIGECIKYRRKSTLQDIFDLPPQNEEKINFWKKEFRLRRRRYNQRIGQLCRLNHIAIEREWYFYTRLQNFCMDRQIPLFVLGPISHVDLIENLSGNHFMQYQENLYGSKLIKAGIPHYFFHSLHDDEGNFLYKKDRVHLNEKGHAFLAKELYPILLPWVSRNGIVH